MIRFISAQANIFELRKDGKLILQGPEFDCYKRLQRIQSSSADWAMKYEGYTINSITEDWKDHYTWYAPQN